MIHMGAWFVHFLLDLGTGFSMTVDNQNSCGISYEVSIMSCNCYDSYGI